MSNAIRNSYPELPVIPYKRSTVNPDLVKSFINTLNYTSQQKTSIYTVFAIESGHGKSGVNNNYGGIQADSGRWGQPLDKYIIGTSVVPENTTGKMRRFAVFADWKTYITALSERLVQRGLFVGGQTSKVAAVKVDSILNFARAYEKEWVQGKATAEPTKAKIDTVSSVYNKHAKDFTTSTLGDQKKK